MTFDEFWTAARAHRPTSRVKLVGAIILFALLASQLAISALSQTPHKPHARLAGVVLLVAFACALSAYFPLKRRRYKLFWKRRQQDLIRLDISERGVAFERPNSRLEMKWSGFCRSVELPPLFMLYSAKNAYAIVPKRAFADDAQVEEFRDLLRRHIQPQTRGFPVDLAVKAEQTL